MIIKLYQIKHGTLQHLYACSVHLT